MEEVEALKVEVDVMTTEELLLVGGGLDVEELTSRELDEEVKGWALDEAEMASVELAGGELDDSELTVRELDDAALLVVEVPELANGPEIGVVITGEASTLEAALEMLVPGPEDTGGPEETPLENGADALEVPGPGELVLRDVLGEELPAMEELGVDTGRLEELVTLLLGGPLGAIPPTMAI